MTTDYHAMGCYCWECGGARTVVEDSEHRARLDCGHFVCWDDGSGVWRSLSEPDLISRETGVEIPG